MSGEVEKSFGEIVGLGGLREDGGGVLGGGGGG